MIGPERKHVLSLKIEADSIEDLSRALDQISFDVLRHDEDAAGPRQSVSGGVSSSHIMEHRVNQGQSHDAYFVELEACLESIREKRVGDRDEG